MKKFGLLTLAALLLVPALTASRAEEVSKTKNSKKTGAIVLNINRASAEDFEKLPGIGPELARRIVAYREKHGPFRRVEDLLAIEDMGPKKWRAIRPYLRVADKPDENGSSK